MNITKFGHCCLLVEVSTSTALSASGVRILTDPGMYSVRQQSEVQNIDFVLITHEHADHFHIESLKVLLQNNPSVKVITNTSVGAHLAKEGIAFDVVEDGQQFDAGGVLIEGIGKDHALMHSSIPPFQNTGYFIANKLFYPGDAFTNPHRPVEILALPVSAPWMKLPEAIDYALELKPKMCFPVHDGILISPGSVHTIPPRVLEPQGITFMVLEIDKEYEL